MKRNISCRINGRPTTLAVDVRESLIEVLRGHGYSSVKEGCGVGECGACTVLIDDMPVDSCLFLAVWAAGRSIRTTEGESRNGRLSAVQQAYLDTGAVQCGFCTPGLIMTSTAFVEMHKDKAPVSRAEIRRAHAGNLCRCTGYESIVRAVERCLSDEKNASQDANASCQCRAEDDGTSQPPETQSKP